MIAGQPLDITQFQSLTGRLKTNPRTPLGAGF